MTALDFTKYSPKALLAMYNNLTKTRKTLADFKDLTTLRESTKLSHELLNPLADDPTDDDYIEKDYYDDAFSLYEKVAEKETIDYTDRVLVAPDYRIHIVEFKHIRKDTIMHRLLKILIERQEKYTPTYRLMIAVYGQCNFDKINLQPYIHLLREELKRHMTIELRTRRLHEEMNYGLFRVPVKPRLITPKPEPNFEQPDRRI
jgi:hypothetical protein